MKKIFLSLILCASVSLVTLASPQKGNHKRGDRSQVMKELNLTSEQQEKVNKLNKDFKAKFDAVKEDGSLAKETKREKIKELSEQRRTQLMSVLTPEQQTKWKESRAKKMEGAKKRHKNFSDGKADRMKSLNLTEDQKTKMQALKDDSSLSKEDKANKRKELATSHRSQVQSLLTPEQQTKWKENHKQGRKDFRHKKDFSGKKGQRGDRKMKLDAETSAKLDALRQDFQKQKQAIELSRIAPEAQKERILNLKEKYRADKKEIIKDARQKRGNNKAS